MSTLSEPVLLLEPLEPRNLFSVTHYHLTPGSLNPSHMMTFGKAVVFAGDTEGLGRELWFSDGTAANTRVIADLYPGVVFKSKSASPIAHSGNIRLRTGLLSNRSTAP